MLDHIGIRCADFARSLAFFQQALAPLGIGVVMQVSAEQTGAHDHAGFGRTGKPDFWIGNAPGAHGGVHVASVPPAAPRWMPSTRRHWPPAAATTVARACASTTTPTTTARSCSIRTATTSKRSATARAEPGRWPRAALRTALAALAPIPRIPLSWPAGEGGPPSFCQVPL